MTRETIIKELKKANVKFNKVIFHPVSPYQKRRFKEKYVGWEAWIYNNSKYGNLIIEEDWNNEKYRQTFLETI